VKEQAEQALFNRIRMVVEHSASQVQDRYDLYCEVKGQAKQALLRVTRLVNTIGGSVEEQAKRALSNVTRLVVEQRSRATSWILFKVTRSVVEQLTSQGGSKEEQAERVLVNRRRRVVEHRDVEHLTPSQKDEHRDVEQSTSQEVGHRDVEHLTTQKDYDYEVEVEEEPSPPMVDADTGYAEKHTKRV
jgi:hypothetical protein